MALSDEQKKQIEEEEAYRAEIKQNLKQPPTKKKGIGCLGIFLIFLVIGFVLSIPTWNGQSKTNSTPKNRENFKASVNFTGTQFVITNSDDLGCENAKLQINGGSYSLDGYKLDAGSTYTVGALQFTKSDGTRFNPYQVKTQSFNIYCSLIGSTNALGGASWYGEFK